MFPPLSQCHDVSLQPSLRQIHFQSHQRHPCFPLIYVRIPGLRVLFVLIVGGNVVEGKFLYWSEMLFPSLCCAYEEERVEDLGSYIILLSSDLGSLLFLFLPSSSLFSSCPLSGNSSPLLCAFSDSPDIMKLFFISLEASLWFKDFY